MRNVAEWRLAGLMKVMKPSSKLGVTFVEENEVVVTKDGRISDSHFISPEADVEKFRMVGALAEMLFEETKRTFTTNSILVIAGNEDFKIVMFPKDDGIVVWKTNMEVQELIRALDRSKSDQGK